MLSPETLRRIRRIEFTTRKQVNNLFAGAYHAVFKGRGMIFDSVRPYEPGDDVRDIDWNVTARAGQPFVKRYVEEREITVMIVLDSSASLFFGTVRQQKRDLAAELGAVLAYAALTNNDKVGLLIFSDRIELYTPPRKGRHHISRLIRDLLAAKPAGKGTDLSLALRTMDRALHNRAVIFVISDFLTPAENYQRDLMILNRRHDVIAITLDDPLEQSWPEAGLIALRDSESGLIKWIDTTPQEWRRGFEESARSQRKSREDTLTRAGVDRIEISPDGDYLTALSLFFRRRTHSIAR